MAAAIPQTALDNCPISRMFGPMAAAEKLQRKYHPNCLGGTGAAVLAVRDKYA